MCLCFCHQVLAECRLEVWGYWGRVQASSLPFWQHFTSAVTLPGTCGVRGDGKRKRGFRTLLALVRSLHWPGTVKLHKHLPCGPQHPPLSWARSPWEGGCMDSFFICVWGSCVDVTCSGASARTYFISFHLNTDCVTVHLLGTSVPILSVPSP